MSRKLTRRPPWLSWRSMAPSQSLLSCLIIIQACAAIPSAQEVKSVEDTVKDARSANAYQCAPRELALAESNLEFAELELAHGNPSRAQEHLHEAELNAKAAVNIQGSDCGVGPVVTRSLKGMVSPKSDDRDGDGVRDSVDLCPDEPEDLDGYVDRDGCPDDDNDKDGISDPRDRCPNAAEDLDAFQDEDGCPDADNDKDGVVDKDDACPLMAGAATSQGCNSQSYRGIVLTDDRVEVNPPLAFPSGSATLDTAQQKVLAELARLLRDRPSLTLAIEAYTDSRGEDAANFTLTQLQADTIRELLVQYGTEGTRLTAKGYGETRPLESNRTSQGRAVNRRVEFLRTDSVQH